MATYLIDYENVKSEGIKGIAQLSEEDRVVIFYSHNADTITFEAMDMIFNSKAQVSKYKILCGGKNALDFQLSTYLGYLIHEAKDSYFYIISKDNGFKHVVDFWKRTFRFDGYVYSLRQSQMAMQDRTALKMQLQKSVHVQWKKNSQQ